ncbi:MAG: hypothetical protein U0935_19810 [Pirellulales bacterium]
MMGSLSCSSAACHGQPADRSTSVTPRGREFTEWLAHDPHAHTGKLLQQPAYQALLSAAIQQARDAGQSPASVTARCATCHDPANLASARPVAQSSTGAPSQTLTPVPAPTGAGGVGCEACHGPAERWLATHYQRGSTPQSRAAEGWLDLSQLTVRARICAKCHLGDATGHVDHDLLAIGHPPLRFELSAYHDLIRRAHWTEDGRVRTPAFKLRLWQAGQWAAIDATLELLSWRATQAMQQNNSPAGVPPVRAGQLSRDFPWPEFAEYDCFACHQRLRGRATLPVNNTRRIAGVPSWQPWNLGLLGRHAAPADSPWSASAGAVPTSPAWVALRQLMQRRLLVEPQDVPSAVQAAQAAWRHVADDPRFVPRHSESSDSWSVEFDSLLQYLGALPAQPLDWHDACQRLLALKAAHWSLRDAAARAHRQSFQALSPAEKPPDFSRDFQQLSYALGFGARDFDWPRLDWQGLPQPVTASAFQNWEEVGVELRRLALEMQSRGRDIAAILRAHPGPVPSPLRAPGT